VITGATSGIGRAAAEKLAAMGWSVAIVGRDEARGGEVLEALQRIAPDGQFRFYRADLTRLADMRRLAQALDKGEARIDVLINNAGAIFGKRMLTEDGIEMTMALNHVAPFVVTNLLRNKLMASSPARVITTASRAHQSGRIALDDLTYAKGYSGMRAYADSKLFNILFTRELARRMEGTGVTANCFHPGLVASRFAEREDGGLRLFRIVLRVLGTSTVKGAETAVHLATSADMAETTGQYFVKCEPSTPGPRALDGDMARRLWEATAHMAHMDAYLAV
jgi:NAD(P)-dependent dehydrogenase (short-subunit alcohol dehydrogenase family)